MTTLKASKNRNQNGYRISNDRRRSGGRTTRYVENRESAVRDAVLNRLSSMVGVRLHEGSRGRAMDVAIKEALMAMEHGRSTRTVVL